LKRMYDTSIFENNRPSTARRGQCHHLQSRTFWMSMLNWNVVVRLLPQLEILSTYLRRHHG
jgi:hypothetical protein